MTSRFDAALLQDPAAADWREVFVALKPGAHLIAVAAPGNWPLIGLYGRAAGFELRDALAHVFPGGWEPMLLFRKPLDGTVVDNALTHKTGGLNVDAARVFTDWDEPDRPETWKRSGHTAQPDAFKIAAPPGQGIVCHPGGRWPTNLVLTHAEGCQRVGTKKIQAAAPAGKPCSGQARTRGVYGKDDPSSFVGHGSRVDYADGSGQETITAWDCVQGCPVLALDELSGERRSAGNYPSDSTNEGDKVCYGKGLGAGQGPLYDDFGGASRFFPQFTGAVELTQWLVRLILPPDGQILRA